MLSSACCHARVKTMIWTILGVSVAVVAIFCVAVSEFLVGTPFFEARRPHVALALAFCGVVLWFLGRYFGRRRGNDDGEGLGRMFLLFDLRYWGPMFLVLGVITLFVQRLAHVKEVTVQAKTAPARKAAPPEPPLPPPPPELPKSNAPVVFPQLKLQGVLLKTGQPTVIIDGNGYAIGDSVKGVVITQITREGVIVEKDGERQLVSLE
jgi:hypothetical protein